MSAELYDALITQQQQVVRLGENHYLVRWESKSDLWCVIDMAALDQHTETCAVFRFRQYCEHLDLIYRLSAQEKEAGGASE